MQGSIDAGRRLRAMNDIKEEFRSEKIPDSDPQMKQAGEMLDKIQQRFHSATRETFTVLLYPRRDRLVQADIRMEFKGNDYNGEEQIRNLLQEKGKFTDQTHGDEFREKCEERIFTTQTMKWSEVKFRAATNADWQWHDPHALDDLRDDCLRKEKWRQDGDYIDKSPPPAVADVTVREISRNDDTGEVTLRVEPRNADEVFYDTRKPTKASKRVERGELTTSAMRLFFSASDSSGAHPSGEAYKWENRITLKYRLYQSGADKRLERRAAPPAKIRYTTDGSDPKVQGGTCEGDISVPRSAQVVLAYAEKDQVESDPLRVPIDWNKDENLKIDPQRPASWGAKQSAQTTAETYTLLERMKKYDAGASGITVTVAGTGREWVELTMFDRKHLKADALEAAIGALRAIQNEGQVKFEALRLHFTRGQALMDWVSEVRGTIDPAEITQS